MIRSDISLSSLTTVGVGTIAEVIMPENVSEMSDVNEDIVILGAGSNVLFSDHRRFRILSTSMLTEIYREKDGVYIGAGVTSPKMLSFFLKHGLGGAEFLSGIPGSAGGLLTMNAGAFGKSMQSIVTRVYCYDLLKREEIFLKADEIDFSYRKVSIDRNLCVTGIKVRLEDEDETLIRKSIRKNRQHRMKVHPRSNRSFGSAFRNPEGKRAWKLICECGLSGSRRGDAVISPKHCNFIINLGRASFADVCYLLELCREKVYNRFNIKLEYEVKIYT
ncbi:MAG: UDP-N-acetylmuramate dehydrogenase [Candidatus Muiribacteriaceae bacterium]